MSDFVLSQHAFIHVTLTKQTILVDAQFRDIVWSNNIEFLNRELSFVGVSNAVAQLSQLRGLRHKSLYLISLIPSTRKGPAVFSSHDSYGFLF